MERFFGKGIFGTRFRLTFHGLLKLLGICAIGISIGVVGSIDSLHMKLLEFTLLLLSLFISVHIYVYRSNLLLPYTLLIWVVSPEIRRIVDWTIQSYTETSIISLIPYCVSLTLLLPIIKNIKFIDRRVSMILKILAVALIYGFCIGFLKYRFSSVYDLLNYIVPFLAFVYVSVSNFDRDVRDKWLKSFSFLAVLVAAYGIYQYLFLPPWDKFWMISSEMNSIGLPEPQKFRVFSLLNSPGPAGVFLGLALAIMTVQKRWRSFGIFGMMIVAFALLLTLVRVGWIAYVVMVAAYFIRSQLKSKMKLLALGVLIFLAYTFILPILPGANNVTARIETLGSLEEDHSFNERLNFSSNIISQLFSNPVGRGLGSSGLGAKLTNNTDTLVAFDNGYLNILYTFGLPLGLGVIATLIYLFFYLFKLSKNEKIYSPISLAAISAVLFLLFASNVMRGLSGFILFFVVSLAYLPKSSTRGEI